MAAHVNARLTILDLPTVSELVVGSDGQTHFRGSKVYESLIDTMIRMKMNLTFVLNSEKGLKLGVRDTNGTFDGLIGIIQANKADLSLGVCSSKLEELPGKLSPVITENDEFIATDDYNPKTVSTTAFDCVKIFDINIYLLTFMTVFLVIAFHGSKRLSRSIWMICGLVFGQNYRKAIGFRNAQLLLILLFLSLRCLFNSRYSTEAAIQNPPKPVNTLDDLYRSNRKLLWSVSDANYYEFKQGVTKMHAKIWSLRTNRSIITNEIDPSLLESKHIALLCADYNLLPAKKLFCTLREWKLDVRSGKRHLHISESFGRIQWSILYSRSVNRNLEERIHRLSQEYLEHQLQGHTIDTLLDAYLPQTDNGCVNSITNPLREDKPPGKVDFNFLALKFFFAVLLILLLVGTIEIFALQK